MAQKQVPWPGASQAVRMVLFVTSIAIGLFLIVSTINMSIQSLNCIIDPSIPMPKPSEQVPVPIEQAPKSESSLPVRNLHNFWFNETRNMSCTEVMEHFHALNDAYRNGVDPKAAAPLINYGFYSGQGFGRLVEHSASHCMLALLVNRPCAVDLSDRDPYWTWRTFINKGSYDWEMNSNERLKAVSANVTAAIGRLERQDLGHWKEPIPAFDDLLLMKKPLLLARNFWKDSTYMRGDIDSRPLLSPNWGPWFPSLKLPSKIGRCPSTSLQSYIQNALYQPTLLSHKLHQERKTVVLGPRSVNRYGAVHLRFVILRLQDPMSIYPRLRDCLRSTAAATGLQDWWLIADNPEIALQIVELFQNESQKDPSVPTILYQTTIKENGKNWVHSNDRAAKGKFGHAAMYDSITDWMVLYDAEVAVVTTGAFGATAARGNNKTTSLDCAPAITLYERE